MKNLVYYWLLGAELCPPNYYVEVRPPRMDVIGDRAFKEVITFNKVFCGPQSNLTGVLLRRRQTRSVSTQETM